MLVLPSVAPAQANEEPDRQTPPANDIVVIGHGLKEVDSGKANVPLLETPQPISVVTADDIADRGVTRLAEALRGVAGVSRSSTYGFFDAYQIRGYDAAYGSVYLDGVLSDAGTGTNYELAGLEQVEVVKGPASALFGAAPLGGIVNFVSKKPQADAFMNVTLATGSYDLIEGAVDANAPLNASGSLSARINLVYRDADSFVRFSGQNRLYISPALKWQIGAQTSLTVLGTFQRDRDRPFSPLSAWGTVLPNANGETPIDFSVNNDGDQDVVYDQDRKSIGYIFDHRFSDAIGFSQTLRYTHRTSYWDRWMFVAGFIDDEIVDGVQQGRVLGRYLYGLFDEDAKDFAVDNRATAKFDTGGISHNILAGVDYRQNRFSYTDGGGNFDPAANPIDLFDPDYSIPLVYGGEPYGQAGRSHQTGIYLQDHIGFGERVFLTLGGRWDWTEDGSQKDHAFSPRVGATVFVADGIVLYANYAKSFTPQVGLEQYLGEDANGDPIVAPLPPERGRNIEGGVKFALPGQRLTGMISVFDLVRQNVATDDPAHFGYSLITGEQQSQGVEVEAQWQPAPTLTLGLAYAYIEAKITEDTIRPIGKRLPNVPRHAINLYASYVVPDGALEHLGVNAGFLYNSSKDASAYFDELVPLGFTLPAYTILDAGLSYGFAPWTARLNVNNILNERYFPDSCCLDRVTPGEPRNFRLSVTRAF